MNPIEYKITLDCRRAESQVIITAKQGEASGRKITFSLNEGRLPYKVPSGVTAVFRAKKPSGAVLYNTCTVTPDGNVEYIITTQTVAEVGKLPCELQLSQDGKVIFSPNFTLLVYKNLSVDSEVESSDEFTALQAAINRAENLTDGTTFTPSVSEDGILSWTNDGGKANPAPVNIKGPQGEKGEDGIGGTFRINVTYSDGVYSADKTLSEIKAAYDAGQQPFVVQTDGTLDLVYTLASFDAPTDGSEPKFVDFERYLAGDGILETEMLRIYSYTTDSGSNVVKRIDEFKMPTSLKNPNALTFTGGATGSYDGSEPETVHIPVIPYKVINENTAARHSHDNKTVLDSITADDIAKLTQEPLDGTTLTLTPTQVYDAVSVGRPVKVQHFDGTYGSLSFTVFNAESSNVIVSQRIISANGEYILAELIGNKPNGTWNFVTTTLAGKTDTPSLEGYATEAYVQNYHDNTKQDIITDLATIRSGASKGATAVQPEAGKGLFSGSYNDLTDKPAIPAAVTEGTVSGWGFTKNTGTYSKPAGGIPKSDLAAAVQTSLGKADTALQEHQSLAAYRTAAAQDVIDSGKVDKVTGKGLSTNDYTAAAKAKVDAIPANPKYTDTVYDDTALKERVATIEGKESAWDAKSDFSGSYNDLTDKPTIPDISGKQDKLIAGEGITIAADGKTISSSGATVFQTKSITDTGGYFTTDTVEGALQEIGTELAGINTLLGSGIQISFTIDGDPFSAVSGETWKEWIGGYSRVISEISGLTLYCFSDDGIIFADEAGVNALGLNDVWVHGNETIVSGATYAIIPCGG